MVAIPNSPALSVIVSPAVQVAVEVGAQVKLECAAIGNLIERLEWAKDVELITNNKVVIIILPLL